MTGQDRALPAPQTGTHRRRGTAPFYSPLRYPGGKRKLAGFVALVVRANRLLDGDYAEVYAGGGAVALSLLYGEYVRRIHINDLDRGIHALWLSARDSTAALCRLIRAAPVTMNEWERQRAVQAQPDPDPLELALSTFYLNRTNRSGIITGGVIGGRRQDGVWKIDARFDKEKLIQRIERIGRNRSRISIYRRDGAEYLRDVVPALPDRTLLYLDPPYYVKGQQELYANYYNSEDHAEIAGLLPGLSQPWLVSYDNIGEVRELYTAYQRLEYGISYSANKRYRGREVAFFSPGLTVPAVRNPTRIERTEAVRLAAAIGN